MWFTALNLYLIKLNNNSLLMTTINGVTVAIAFILFAGTIGSLIDKYQRIKIIRVSLLIQNSSVAISCIIVICIMILKDYLNNLANEWLIFSMQALIIFLNCLSTLASMAVQVSLERDWIIIIADDIMTKRGNKGKTGLSEELAHINSISRRFDVMTSMLTPLFIGLIISLTNGILISAIIIALWNMVSYFIEFRLLTGTYEGIKTLQKDQVIIEETSKKTYFQLFKQVLAVHKGYFVYFKLGILSIAGISLALVFMSVLNFDSLTIEYSKSQKLGKSLINLLRAISGFTGVIGTIIFAHLHNRCKLSLKKIGLGGLIILLMCSLICIVSLWIPDSSFILYTGSTTSSMDSINQINITSNSTASRYEFFLSSTHNYTSILMLLIGISISRFGLWLFDLSVNQMMQEKVVENERGIIGGIQNALNKLFDMIKLLLVLFLNDFSFYGYLILLSFLFVALSSALFIIFIGYSVSLKCYRKVPKNEDVKEQNDETAI